MEFIGYTQSTSSATESRLSGIPLPLLLGSLSLSKEQQQTVVLKQNDSLAFLGQHFFYMHVRNYYTIKPNIADFVKQEAKVYGTFML